MAMKLDGRDARLRRATFIAAGEPFDLRRRAVEAALDELVDAIEPAYARLAEIGFDARKTRALEKALRERAAALR